MNEPRIHTYYRHSNEKEILRGSLDELLGTRNNLVALDVGAGRGDATQPLYERAMDMTMLDREPSYQDIWRDRFPKAKRIIGSIETASLGRYDWILFSHGLYYHDTKDWEALCRRLFDTLRPGGELCLVMNTDQGDWWEIVNRFQSRHSWNCQLHYTPWSGFRSKLTSWGNVRSTRISYTLSFPATHDLLNYTAHACLSLAQPWPRNAREHILEAYHDMGRIGAGPLNLHYESEILCLKKPDTTQ